MKQIFRPVPAVLLACSALITWVCASLISRTDDGGWQVGSYAVWGDWSAHLTFISAFRERGLGWVFGSSPLMSGTPFHYPFLSHLLTALVCDLFGIPSISGLTALSLALLFLLPILLYRFIRKFQFSIPASLFSTLAFIFMGGFQFFDTTLDSKKALTNQFDQGSVFTQFVLFEFLPQRAFLFGLTWVLIALPIALHSQSKVKRTIGTLALGLLPLIHLHTFLALGAFLMTGLVLFRSREILKITVVLSGIGGACMAILFLRSAPESFHWNLWAPLWAQGEAAHLSVAQAMNPFLFWLYNTGFILPFALYGLWVDRTRKDVLWFGCGGLFLFLVALFVQIQPYFYDNLKIFTWAFLFLIPVFASVLERIASINRFIPWLLLFIQCLSGLTDFYRFHLGIEHAVWFKGNEISLAADFKNLRSSPEALVLTGSRHNHWIPALAGNPVVMGYPGWLWSWGIPYSAREQEVREILTGGPGAEAALHRLSPSYIVVERGEQIGTAPIQFQYLDSKFQRILTREPWIIYRVSP